MEFTTVTGYCTRKAEIYCSTRTSGVHQRDREDREFPSRDGEAQARLQHFFLRDEKIASCKKNSTVVRMYNLPGLPDRLVSCGYFSVFCNKSFLSVTQNGSICPASNSSLSGLPSSVMTQLSKLLLTISKVGAISPTRSESSVRVWISTMFWAAAHDTRSGRSRKATEFVNSILGHLRTYLQPSEVPEFRTCCCTVQSNLIKWESDK